MSFVNHLRTDDVYIRACKLLPKRRMTYIYARKHFFLKSIPSGTLRARHGENRPQVVKKAFVARNRKAAQIATYVICCRDFS